MMGVIRMIIEIKEVNDVTAIRSENQLLINGEVVKTGDFSKIKEKLNKIIDAWF